MFAAGMALALAGLLGSADTASAESPAQSASSLTGWRMTGQYTLDSRLAGHGLATVFPKHAPSYLYYPRFFSSVVLCNQVAERDACALPPASIIGLTLSMAPPPSHGMTAPEM